MSTTAAQDANEACSTLVSCTGTARSRDGCAEQHIDCLGAADAFEAQGSDSERMVPAANADIGTPGGESRCANGQPSTSRSDVSCMRNVKDRFMVSCACLLLCYWSARRDLESEDRTFLLL